MFHSGIQSRLDHFEYLGIKAIWLSPIFASPMKDFGYDIADQKMIEPMFGTMEDFDDLIKDIHSRGMTKLCQGLEAIFYDLRHLCHSLTLLSICRAVK